MICARRLLLTLVVLVVLAIPAALAASPPVLELHAPDELAGLEDRLRRLDPAALERVVELVGLDDAGPPIPVILALEGSLAAQAAPEWGIAYATHLGNIVLIPKRIPGYPHETLESVLLHEVAHVLIDRAAGGRPVPRWFHEGLALLAGRDWGLEDRSRVLWATLRGRGSTLAVLDAEFESNAVRAARAYAFAGAFVRDLVDRHGRAAPGEILAGVGRGLPFDAAFRDTTGLSLADAERAFFRHLEIWDKWVPILTSSVTLWTAITLLFLWAFKRRRERDAEIRARWDLEESRWLREGSTDGWVN